MAKHFKAKIKKYRAQLFLLLIIILLLLLRFYQSSNHINSKINISKNIINSPSITPTPPPRQKAKITKVVDGDTVVLSTGEQVRYIGINTPEFTDEGPGCFAVEAKNANTALVLNQDIELESDINNQDKYGRLLRYVYVEGEMINQFLVTWGFARAETAYPEKRYFNLFEEAQSEAKSQNRGLWGKCKE